MQSFMSIVAKNMLKYNGYKKKVNDVKREKNYLEERRIENLKPYKIPASTKMKSLVQKEALGNMEIFYINKNEVEKKKSILYLHGGSYIEQPVVQHWTFLDRIAAATDVSIIVPIYPKAPGNQYSESFKYLMTIYQSQLADMQAENIIFMGDSAGGGLALAFAQYLLENKLPQPGKIILLSPWLDITMENKQVPSLDKKDPTLGIYGLIQAGKAWAGATDPHYYMLSPMFGELHGLAEISLFVGTHELFLPDARKFRDLAREQNIMINYYEYPKMNHDFPLFPIPEAKKAQKQIIDIINR